MITFLNSTNPNHFSSAAQSVDSVEPEIPPPVIDNSWKSCAICLEDMADSELRKHTSCTCLLCQQCIEVNLFNFKFLIFSSIFVPFTFKASCRHHRTSFGGRIGEYLQCPVCGMDVKPEEEFAPLDKLHCYRPVIRLLNIPILLRLASTSRAASPKSSRLIGHPRLLQLPNLVSPKSLYETVEKFYPKLTDFDLCFVDQQVFISIQNQL